MTVTAIDQADILTRVFRPEVADMSEDAARSMLAFTFSTDDRERMDTLAAKARDGSLDDVEIRPRMHENCGERSIGVRTNRNRHYENP